MNRIIFLVFIVFFQSMCLPAFAGKAMKLSSGSIREKQSNKASDFNVIKCNVFDAGSREVIWFGEFKGFMTAYKANLIAEWIKPSGESFKRENFSTDPNNSGYGWARLDLRGSDSGALDFKGEWTLKVYWDEELIDTDMFMIVDKRQPPMIRVLEGDRIVYEGPENVNEKIWELEKISFNDLKEQGAEQNVKRIAILAYPYELDIAVKGWAFDRGKYMSNKIKKEGFVIHSLPEVDRPIYQHGYSFTYNIAKKDIETDFMMEAGNGYFPYDLSDKIAERTAEHFAQNGYSVVNLSVSRDELSGKSLSEIKQMTYAKFGIDKLLLIPNRAYTKWTWNMGNSTQTEVGMLLCYAAVLVNHDSEEPLFTFTDNVDLGENRHALFGSPIKNLPGRKVNFYGVKNLKDQRDRPNEKADLLTEGVFDDVWTASVVLRKFSGQALYMIDQGRTVEIPGPLFKELEKKGYL